MEKVACIMVTYNPDAKAYETLKKLIKEEVFIILIDNGSGNSDTILDIQNLMNVNKMFFYSFKVNMGLAKAQNEGIRIAQKLKYDFAVFFDQDTIIPANYFSEMLHIFKEYEKKFFPKLGILAPNFIDRNTNETSRFAVLTDDGYYHKKIKHNDFEEVSFVVSSGSMLRLSVIEEVGLFIDNYFIDQIDVEYSLRLLSYGYSIVVTSKVKINHTIGDRTKRQLLFFTIRPNNHNSLRKYYIFRNGLKTIEIYKSEFKGIKRLIFMRLVHDFLGVIFFEDSKREKINAIFKGVKDSKKSIDDWEI